MSDSRFEGKVVFVTGGASGLGEGTARRFAKEGARLVIADINEEGAQSVAESLPEAMAIKTDTSRPRIGGAGDPGGGEALWADRRDLQ